MPYTIDVSAVSAAPPEVLFEHLAVAEAWSVWGRLPAKPRREREGDKVPNGEGAIRKIGPTREQVVAYDPPRHYAYIAVSGLPVKEYRADVTFTERPEGGTAIRWQGRIEPRIPGSGPLIRLFLARMLGGFVQGVARHAERCEPGCPAHAPVP